MQIQTNRNQRELKSHGDVSFPILVSHESITSYELNTFSWHWHPEIELTLIEEGEMMYQINGHEMHVQKGDLLFSNCNALHSGHSIDGRACYYWSITFDSKLIYGFENSLIQTKYVDAVVSAKEFSSLLFDGSESWHQDLKELVCELISLSSDKSDFYEIKIQMQLTKIWLMLLEHRTSFSLNENALNPKTSARLKTILSFIHENFEKKISLDDIANSVHLCKSECCRFFKKHMQESLFDYLLRYRIEQSIPYLRNPEFSITETALCCGFSDAGYYSRMFKRYTGMSPRDYRIGLFPDYDR